MAQQEPAALDTTIPNVARMYDYWLEGKDHFAADREAARKLMVTVPHAALAARANRAFLRRAVRVLAAEQGIRQFIDVGTGLPTAGNVHEIALQAAPEARVVYVDNDPVVCCHARALLACDEARILEADLRRPDEIIGHPLTRELIDFSKPIALMFVSVLHFVPDDDEVRAVLARFREVMAPGSYLVISHVSNESDPDDPRVRRSSEVYSQSSASLTPRSLATVGSFFDGFELLDPGLVWVSDWRPNRADPYEHVEGVTETLRGGVARKVA